MNKKTLKILIIVFLIISSIAILVIIDSFSPKYVESVPVSLNEFRDFIVNKAFSRVDIYGRDAEGFLQTSAIQNYGSPGTTYANTTILPNNMEDWLNLMISKGVKVTIKDIATKNTIRDILLHLLSGLLTILSHIIFFRFLIGSGFSRQKYQLIKTNITFRNVAGMESIKNEVFELIDCLKNREKYKKMNCRTPKGLLISGPPGNGKTLLAKAIAGESGVNFIFASAASFIAIFAGTGPKAIKELFETARKNAPCVIFIDEMESLGDRRNTCGGAGGERNNTINEFLTQMDGLIMNEGILVIGATNYPEDIDPAALRSGRFDRKVAVHNPNYRERLLVLNLYLEGSSLDFSVSIERLASNTSGFSRADLENLVNEAKMLAVRHHSNYITDDFFKESFDRIVLGLQGERISEKEMINTAYHEAGHAFLYYTYKKVLGKIYKATIIPRGTALGMVMPENNDKDVPSKGYLEAKICVTLAGRIAEEMFFGLDNATAGCSSDLQQARRYAEIYIKYGMSERYGFQFVYNDPKLQSQEENNEIRRFVSDLIKEMELRTREIMLTNKDKIGKLALILIQQETLTGDQIDEILSDKLALPVVRKVKSAINFNNVCKIASA